MSRLSVLILTLAGGDSFEGVAWVDAAPDLQGKVALVRWWTKG